MVQRGLYDASLASFNYDTSFFYLMQTCRGAVQVARRLMIMRCVSANATTLNTIILQENKCRRLYENNIVLGL